MVTVIARDGDTGVDAEIFYSLETTGNSLIDGELSFAIDEVTGEIAVNVTSLDRETHSSYSLTVQVCLVSKSSCEVHPLSLAAGCSGQQHKQNCNRYCGGHCTGHQ